MISNPFTSRFFKVLYELEERIVNQELRKWFSIFIGKAKKVNQLHKELNEEFKPAADLFESCLKGAEYNCQVEKNIGDVIISKKHQFLMYAPFITQCLNLTELIKEMKNKEGLKNEIERLEKFMLTEMSQTRNRNYPITIENLLMMPFQHILRYNFLSTIMPMINRS